MIRTIDSNIAANLLLLLIPTLILRRAIWSNNVTMVPLPRKLIHELLNEWIYASVFIGIVGGYYQDVHNT